MSQGKFSSIRYSFHNMVQNFAILLKQDKPTGLKIKYNKHKIWNMKLT